MADSNLTPSVRLRHVSEFNPKWRSSPDDLVSFLPMEAIGEDGRLDTSQAIEVSEASSGLTAFEEGDVIVAKITPCFENGKGAVARGLLEGKALGTTELHVLRPLPGVDARYLWWNTVTPHFRAHGAASMTGAAGQQRVTPEFVKDFRILLPPLVRQREIADYLDRETAKIDALIAENERLLQLLDERRQALITQAVTKGLDPTVPMKDSGLPWLGQIPAHWQLVPLKAAATINDTVLSEDTDEDFEFRYIDIGNVTSHGEILEPEILHFKGSPSRARRIVKVGDVIVSTVRTYLRAIAPITEHFAECIVSTGFAVVRPLSTLAPEYAKHLLRTPYFVSEVESRSVGVSYPAITSTELAGIKVPMPEPSEQIEIATAIAKEAAPIEEQLNELRSTIGLLRERRTALISQAVTGQLNIGAV